MLRMPKSRQHDLLLFALCTVACSGEPVRSYCEALCDWAVACNATTRGVDPVALTAQCLEATHAVDGSCATAEAGTLDPASKALLKPCVADIDENADELVCDGFVGSFEEIKTSAPPASCTAQAEDFLGTYNAAQLSTAETGEELCVRFAESLCMQSEACILGDATQWTDATQALGGTPFDVCVERMNQTFTASCISAELWQQDEKLLDVNLARESARECIPSLIDTECDALFAAPPGLSPACATAFTSPDDLVAIGEVLLAIAEEFAAYAP
jgi:uncharacterized Fe-S cluster protein YjdI